MLKEMAQRMAKTRPAWQVFHAAPYVGKRSSAAKYPSERPYGGRAQLRSVREGILAACRLRRKWYQSRRPFPQATQAGIESQFASSERYQTNSKEIDEKVRVTQRVDLIWNVTWAIGNCDVVESNVIWQIGKISEGIRYSFRLTYRRVHAVFWRDWNCRMIEWFLLSPTAD